MKKELLLAVFLFSLTIFLRSFNLQYKFSFNAEYNYKLWAVKKIVDDHKPTLIGLEGVSYLHHLHYPPFALYLFSPLYLVTGGNPIFVEIAEIFLAGITSTILFYLGKTIYSLRLGLLMSLIYSISFFIQNTDRAVWVVGPVMFFSSVYLLTLAKIFLIRKEKVHRYFLLGLITALAMNFHYQTWALIPGAIFFMILTQENSFRKNLSGFLIGLIIPISPWVIFELRHNFYNLQGILFLIKDGTGLLGKSFTTNVYKSIVVFGQLPFNILLNIELSKIFLILSLIGQIILFYQMTKSIKFKIQKMILNVAIFIWLIAFITFPLVQNRFYNVSYYTYYLVPIYILFISILIERLIKVSPLLFQLSTFLLVIFSYMNLNNTFKPIPAASYNWNHQTKAITYILKEAPSRDFRIKFVDFDSEELDFLFYYLSKINDKNYSQIHYIERWHNETNVDFLISRNTLKMNNELNFGHLYVSKVLN